MKRTNYLVVLLACMGWSFSPAWSDDTTKPPKTPEVTVEDTDAPNPAKDAEKTQQLATQFGVPEQQVVDMRQTSKMGWGEMRNLLLIAQSVSLNSAGTTTPLTMEQAMQQVLTQRASGMGIGQIANSHNVKLGDLKKDDVSNAKGGKPEKAGRPDKAGKPDKPAKPDKPEKAAKPDKPEKPDNPGKGK